LRRVGTFIRSFFLPLPQCTDAIFERLNILHDLVRRRRFGVPASRWVLSIRYLARRTTFRLTTRLPSPPHSPLERAERFSSTARPLPASRFGADWSEIPPSPEESLCSPQLLTYTLQIGDRVIDQCDQLEKVESQSSQPQNAKNDTMARELTKQRY
jgi:hypothetical protein